MKKLLTIFVVTFLFQTSFSIRAEEKKSEFGEMSSKEFNIGDIVEWSIWNTIQEQWSLKYGIVYDIKN